MNILSYIIVSFLMLIIYFRLTDAQSVVEERTNLFSLLLASIQCFSNDTENGHDNSDSQIIQEIHSNFKPLAHLNMYKNPDDVNKLVDFVENGQRSGVRNDDPFTNSPEHVSQLTLMLNVLYPNTENWQLFYNTSVWLLDRVNSAQLYWALMIVTGEKFTDTVTAPTAVEVFPQLFVPKKEILSAAGLLPSSQDETFPSQYWNSDPGLNEFHMHWHIDNPFWWNETKYGVVRYRKGELFLYMHHQLVNRYDAELLSNGLPEFTAMDLEPDYQIPEGYVADIVNINYGDFPTRRKGERLREWGSPNGKSLSFLKTLFERLTKGIEQGYFKGPLHEYHQISLQGDKGVDVLGSTVEASTVHSANLEYYGSFHNYLHRELSGVLRPNIKTLGVEAHSETSIRDPVFFRLHKKVDSLLLQLKNLTPPYTKNDLDFPGVSIKSVEIQTPRPKDEQKDIPKRQLGSVRWPFGPQLPTLTTYFTLDTYDISTAARSCRSINDEPIITQVKTLTYVPFKFNIVLQSTRERVAYGMIRIFLWPEYTHDGKKLEGDDAHQRAIELDRFLVQIDANKDTIVSRASLNSSLTRLEHPPGIKTLYKIKESSSLLRPDVRRACGFPNNLLIPKGTKEGMKFKLTVYVSDETDTGWIDEYPKYPFCGTLNGIPFPDRRVMGFPFDRPGTKFIASEGFWPVVGPTPMKNVKEIRVLIKHQDSKIRNGRK